ncbi:MAG: hypothetical protein GW859_05180 [Sphingomonadales bacterium]|nr:hypothetical protein [Sphingomonadales bacterium]
MTRSARWAIKTAMATAMLALAWPAPAFAPDLLLLGRIEKGNWALRPARDGAVRNICVRSGGELLSLRHRGPGCARYVIENRAGELTVHMTCGKAGHVRTTLRYETPRLIQLDTQGLDGTAPFSESYEARRTGGCG